MKLTEVLCSLVAGIHHVSAKESRIIKYKIVHHLWKAVYVMQWLGETWTDGMGPQSGHLWSLEIKTKVRVEFDIKG